MMFHDYFAWTRPVRGDMKTSTQALFLLLTLFIAFVHCFCCTCNNGIGVNKELRVTLMMC